MKKLWLYFLLFPIQLSVQAQSMIAKDYYVSAFNEMSNLPNFSDSITNIIEGKKFLYYITGHHGHIWALVVSEKDRYICVSGNTRNNDCRIDTIHVEASVLKWGLDTMALYCHKMEPIENTTYWPFYERLVLSSSKKEIIFDSTDTNSYVGTDSVTFNNKLNELKYFMYWIAVPEVVRRKLPTPL